MAVFNTTRLLSQVNLKAALPTGRFSDQEILDLASDALISQIAPMLITSREEYYVYVKDYTIAAGQAAYPIPSRAVGGALREVKRVSGDRILDVNRLDPEDIDSTETGTPHDFYLQNNNIILYPTPSASGDTLRVTYFVRPSTLVVPSNCTQITAINTATNTVTCAPVSGWSIANSFDLHGGTSGYVLKAQDYIPSAISGSSIIFNELPPDLVVGDWVSLAGESCFPHAPADFHQYLTQLTVVACLEALGDQTNLAIAQAKADQLKSALAPVLVNRVQGAPRKFTSSLL